MSKGRRQKAEWHESKWGGAGGSEVQKARPCRGLKAVLRSLGFLSRPPGSHGGVQSKGRTGSVLCFRKTSGALLKRIGGGRNEGQETR